MNKNQAEAWMNEITGLFKGKKLIQVESFRDGLTVRQDCVFDEAYIVDHKDGTYVVALSSGGWTMTGSSKWKIDPNTRTIQAITKNTYGDTILFSWTLMYNANSRNDYYNAFHEAQKRLSSV